MTRSGVLKRIKKFSIFYGITFLVSLVLIYFLILLNDGFNFSKAWSFWKDIIIDIITHPFFWILVFVPYFIFLLIRSLVINYRKNKMKGLLKGLALKVLLPIVILYGFSAALSVYRLGEKFTYTWDYSIENTSKQIRHFEEIDQKQRGIHTFNISRNIEDVEKLKTNNFEWITLTPFIGQKQYNLPELNIPSDERFERTKNSYKRVKKECDVYGIQVMLKPHIWMRENIPGKWRANIEMETEAEWDLWFQNYEKVILMYASLAEELGFEQFCIGTELESTVLLKPQKWKQLIQKARTLYSGKITYAANWDGEYKEIDLWNDLDFIGIQAYFPLTNGTPVLEEMEAAWTPFIEEMRIVHQKFNKPIIFTEMGYRSLKGTSQTPWEWGSVTHLFSRISKKEQYLCYESFFNTVWKEPWFHGLHIWEWQGGMEGGDNTSFSVEYKPAMNLIAKRFRIE